MIQDHLKMGDFKKKQEDGSCMLKMVASHSKWESWNIWNVPRYMEKTQYCSNVLKRKLKNYRQLQINFSHSCYWKIVIEDIIQLSIWFLSKNNLLCYSHSGFWSFDSSKAYSSFFLLYIRPFQEIFNKHVVKYTCKYC